jgi:hypothetical protein
MSRISGHAFGAGLARTRAMRGERLKQRLSPNFRRKKKFCESRLERPLGTRIRSKTSESVK